MLDRSSDLMLFDIMELCPSTKYSEQILQRLLSLRLEGAETLKYRCVCRSPFGKV